MKAILARDERLQAGALLGLALLVFFAPAIFGRRVLLPADTIFDVDPLWRSLKPADFSPANAVLSDQIYQFYPWDTLTARSLAQGELPLWNPYVGGGHPFVGNAQSGLFDPLRWLSTALNAIGGQPFYASYVITALLRLFTAGFFTFLFCREIGLGKAGSLLSMFAFAFCGPMVVWVGYPLASVIAWLPAMLWTTERALRTKSRTWVLWSSIPVGAQFLGGHPETSFLVILAWAAYVVYRAIGLANKSWGQFSAFLLRAAVAGLIGALLAAVQLVPFVDALVHSAALATRPAALTGVGLIRQILLDWHQWPTAITAVLPLYFGTPQDNSYWLPFSNYVEQNLYVGTIPLVLAVTVWIERVHSHPDPSKHMPTSHAGFFLVLAAASLGIALHLPAVNAINLLPVFNIAENGRLRLAYALATSILAGMGLERLQSSRHARHTALIVLCAIAGGGLVLVSLTYGGFRLFREEIIRSGRAFMHANWGTPYFTRPLAHYDALVEQRYAAKLALFCPGNVAMYLPALCCLLYVVAYRWRSPLQPRMWARIAIGLTLVDAFVLGMPFNPALPVVDLYPETDALRWLQQDQSVFRVVGLGPILNPNSGMVFGLSDVRGYDALIVQRYADLVDSIAGSFRIHFHALFVNADSRLLDLLNVKYALSEQELAAPWEQAMSSQGGVKVYQNPNVVSRAFFVYQVEIASSPAASLERVTDPSFDFRTRAVLESNPVGWTEPAHTPMPVGIADIVAYEPNRVAIEADTSQTGLLLLTDTYLPGWRAELDGASTAIYVADHAFRAVIVPPGTHRITFTYRPPAFVAGAAVSLAALILWLFACVRECLARQGGSTH